MEVLVGGNTVSLDGRDIARTFRLRRDSDILLPAFGEQRQKKIEDKQKRLHGLQIYVFFVCLRQMSLILAIYRKITTGADQLIAFIGAEINHSR